MADKTVILEVQLVENNAQSTLNELNTSLKSLDKTHKDYAPTLKLIAQAERDLSKAQQKRILVEKGLTNSTIKVEKATKKTAKEMKQLSTHTGASTSASLELGRVFSDAPYGIRGVANNIQQLASNLFFMSKKTVEATGKTVGFGGALKQLGTGLWGATGVLVAFQAGIALLDYFKVGMSTSADKTEKADEATKEFSSSLKSLEKILTDSGASQDAYNGKIVEYISLKKAQLKLEETLLTTQGKIDAKTEESKESLKDDISLQKALLEAKKEAADQSLIVYPDTKIGRQAKAQAVDYGITIEQIESRLRNNIVFRKQLEQDIIELTKEGIDEITKVEEARKNLAKAEKGTLKNLKQQKSDLEKIRQTTALTSKEYIKQGNDIERIQKLIEEIEGRKDKNIKEVKIKEISPFKTPKELELDVKNNEKALINFNKKLEEYRLKTEMNNKLSASKSEEERFDIKKLYATKLLTSQINAERETLKLNKTTELEIAKSKTDAHIADIKRVFELFKIKVELDRKLKPKQKESLIGDATGKMFDAIGQAGTEGEETADAIRERYKPILKVFEEVKDARFAALFSMFKGKGDDENQENDLDKLKIYAENAMEIIGSIGDFLQAESDRELTIEQNKTNALNTELNNRLLNENLSKDQRAAIQNQIAQNDEKLRIKQNAIKKKAFNTQKAFDMSMAIVDTIAAGVSAAKATYGGPFAKIAAMTAVITAGMAKVAIIARQRFQPDSANTPVNTGAGGAGSGSSGRAEPSFNIVGMGSNNQLLETIQAQFSQPLKAYVVSREVTRQQNLDASINTGASI